MFGMFGRRKTAAASQTDEIQQQRIFPAELWQGPMGDVLRQIGMSPDDPSNLVPTGASIDARVASDRAKHEAKLAELNRDVARRTGGGRVKAYFLFHDPCWNGETGTFLMARLRYFPYDDWNVLFLPEDERTAELMGLPVHPGGPIPGSVEVVEQLVAEAKAKLQAASAEAERTQRYADIEAIMTSIKRDVWGVASYLADHIGARSAWKPTLTG